MEASASILSRLRTQLTGLPALLDGVPRRAFDSRAADKWSVTENIAHLGRYHEVSIERIHEILTSSEPTIPAYHSDADPEWPAWQRRSFEEAMQRLHAARATLIGIIEALSPEQWTRRGKHTRYGPLSLRAWLELFLAHEGHHLYVITRRSRGLE
jgi:hypothetical protein